MNLVACPTAQSNKGFTLIEVLMALAIVAIALMAGTRAASSLLHNAQRGIDITLGQWCAENALIETKLKYLKELPNIGEQSMQCTQAGYKYNVQIITSATVNPSLRRVDAKVSTTEYFVLSISTLIGRY